MSVVVSLRWNADNTLRSSRTICELYSRRYRSSSVYTGTRPMLRWNRTTRGVAMVLRQGTQVPAHWMAGPMIAVWGGVGDRNIAKSYTCKSRR
jgi:hypothetical protein